MCLRLLLPALLVLSACASAPPAASEWTSASATPGATVDVLLDGSVRDGAAALGLGVPLRIDAEPTANRHVRGQVDTVRTYVWDGLTVSDYETAPGRTFRMSVRATSPDYVDQKGLRVGATRADVEAALGTPTYTFDDGTVSYSYLPEPASVAANVTYAGDRVTAISWVLPLD